ncbi:hypothetical protein AVEN_15788-1 [Araneus ventricosus]|uniref:Uncharacterized protein n=1 Tax=Araneus ventricosus TaxID=182803 RepID=A0A4Y2PEY4_ARAVE|nr:hypothetical protein AVEN_15788-1 [Araneus ventricosus]
MLEKVQSPRLTLAHLLLPHTGDFRVYFQHDLAPSRGPNLGSGFVFALPSQRGVKRPSGHSNLISNYSEFQHFRFCTPNFIRFPHRRKVFPSRVPKIAERNSGECPDSQRLFWTSVCSVQNRMFYVKFTRLHMSGLSMKAGLRYVSSTTTFFYVKFTLLHMPGLPMKAGLRYVASTTTRFM